MQLYKKTYQEMIEANKDLFDKFSKISEGYRKDQTNNQKQLDDIGRDIQKIVENTNRVLCKKMEGSGKGAYSTSLSDKFMSEVRRDYPFYDFVGVEVS